MGECAPGGCKKIFLSAERVFPLLEEFWAKEPGLSTMEETTENVRIQFGKRMRITVLSRFLWLVSRLCFCPTSFPNRLMTLQFSEM